MIISASRRTDIPALYADWFMNRIMAGYVLTQNPFNPKQIKHITLSPDEIDCIVFWTKDPQNIIPHLKTLDALGYQYYFQFTITPYDNCFEKNLRPKPAIEETFIELSQLIGKEKIIWRYDPIIVNEQLNINYHQQQFKRLCEKLSRYTGTVIISFVDMYKQISVRANNLIRSLNRDEIITLAKFIGSTARSYHLNAYACCEAIDLSSYGIKRSACIDRERIEAIIGHPLDLKQDRHQRKGCGCYQSIDIGIYNTCINNCNYCYANHSPALAQQRYQAHNPNSALLIDINK